MLLTSSAARFDGRKCSTAPCVARTDNYTVIRRHFGIHTAVKMMRIARIDSRSGNLKNGEKGLSLNDVVLMPKDLFATLTRII